MRQIAEFVSVLARAVFAGASVYIRSRRTSSQNGGVDLAANEFAPSYRRATVMQATLAAVGLISSIPAWFAEASFLWVVGGLLPGAVIPFTLIVILPTNKQLLNPALDKHSGQMGQLLARWGRLHAVRSALSGLALLLFLYLVIFMKSA